MEIIKEIGNCNETHEHDKKLLYEALLYAFNIDNKTYTQNLLQFCKDNLVSVNFQDSDGNTLLHRVTFLDSDKSRSLRNAKIKLLLTYFPALINIQNNNGDTALHMAMIQGEDGDRSLASLLVRAHADIGIKNKSNISPWDFAFTDAKFLDLFTRAALI